MASHTDLRTTLSLDGLNFFLADVRDGLGLYLAIYLLAVHKWDPVSIGVVMTLASIVVQQAGYNAALLILAGVATVALALLWLAMPETLTKPSFACHTTVA